MTVLIGQTLLIFFFVADRIFLLKEELSGFCPLKGCTTEEEAADEVNKTGNVHVAYRWGAFVQPML